MIGSKHSYRLYIKMCGILARLGCKQTPITSFLNRLNARGPEQMRIEEICDTVTMGFTRLAINGLSESGMQPFTKGPLTWICNGEIYNFKQLEAELGWKTSGSSDCACIGDLYLKYRDSPTTFLRALDGVFSLVIYDDERNQLFVARDPYGIRPLFIASKPNFHTMGYSSHMFISEIKAASPYFDIIVPFFPGYFNIYDTQTCSLISSQQYHTIPWVIQPQYSPYIEESFTDATCALRLALEEAVKKRIPSDVEPACLLSGGLDSSLIAALVQQNLKQAKRQSLQTFSIGFKGSSDLKHAKMVASWIGSRHTEIIMSPDQFFDRIPDVIKAIETCDTTTVRASVGNYLVAEVIKQTSDCKVVFNGDGSDELFGGYLYFNNSPDDNEFHAETSRLLQDIHFFDVLRSDRCISAHGLEARTPFLDKQFVALIRSFHPSLLRPILGKQVEKEILRCAFDDGVTLPSEVLWRRKEAFSDGVSSVKKSWYEEIEERVKVPNDWKDIAAISFSNHLQPRTPEEFYYRHLFCSHYGNYNIQHLWPYRWMPKWCPETTDPSARTLTLY